ncbi:MAG: septum site-determining protein MinC [Lachnospiraceae bacterium]|nr:septum site-determining protein MinC [Lachnospiraceae bacterium]
MKNSVVIKSFQNGISLHLDKEMPFEQLLEEISLKFRESSGFFKNAKMALSFEGRELTDDEEKTVVEKITASSDLNIICLVGKDNNTNQNYLKALQMINYDDGKEGQFYRGTLKNGQVLETESSIVIIGDINPGATIISTRDIIILGGLYGEAYAGATGNDGHFVVALEMSPEKLTIGDFKYKAKEKTSKWSIKLKVQPKIAYVKEETIVVEPITKELLSGMY